jgi:hypothetical protein
LLVDIGDECAHHKKASKDFLRSAACRFWLSHFDEIHRASSENSAEDFNNSMEKTDHSIKTPLSILSHERACRFDSLSLLKYV